MAPKLALSPPQKGLFCTFPSTVEWKCPICSQKDVKCQNNDQHCEDEKKED